MSGSACWLVYLLTYLGVLASIVVVDAGLGPVAEYLNAYELLRQNLGLAWPARGSTFLYGQVQLGPFAYPLAWAAWLAEAAVITWGLLLVIR